MGRSIAAFYSPDDDLEHALQLILPQDGLNSGYPIRDVTFSPATQGHAGPGLSYTPKNTIWAVGGTYSPIDAMRYIIYATSDNMVYWTRFSSNYLNPPKDALIYPNSPLRVVGDFSTYPPSSIIDMAAYFTGNQIEVVVLMNDGDLWRMGGAPWSGNLGWSQIPFFANFKGGKRIALFEGAGWGHIIIASDHDLTEVYYTWNQWGQDKLKTFNETISDLAAIYTTEDGVAHIIVAIPTAAGTNIKEITFTPAQVPPAIRLLGRVPFYVESLGGYEKPDTGRHLILQSRPPYNSQEILYLGWYYPWWNGFEFVVWPNPNAW